MREERGTLTGNLIVAEPYTLWGLIVGDVVVRQHGKMYVRGNVYGNVTVEPGGRMHLYGNIQGKLIVKEDAKVIHSGSVTGEIRNLGGRLHIERIAKITGKIKTKSGQTTFDDAVDPRG